MIKRLKFFSFVIFLAVSFCGCSILGAALSESRKAVQAFNVPYADAIEMVKRSVKEQSIEFVSAVIRKDAAEVKGIYHHEKKVYIKIVRLSETASSIQVNVGTSESGKKDAQKILDAIAQQIPTAQ